MLGNPNADNPFATSDPFGPSRADPVHDDFDNVDIGNNAHQQTSSGLYGGTGQFVLNRHVATVRCDISSGCHDWKLLADVEPRR